MRQLAEKLFEMALAGDLDAAKLVMERTLGKPAAPVDPDTMDIAELALLDASPTRVELLRAALRGVNPQTAIEFIRDRIFAHGKPVVEMLRLLGRSWRANCSFSST
jgi:hypothetical protein